MFQVDWDTSEKIEICKANVSVFKMFFQKKSDSVTLFPSGSVTRMKETNIVTEILHSFEKLNVETTTEEQNYLSSVNNRINEEFCENVFSQLQDKNLLSEYKKTPSVIKKIDTLISVLVKNNIDNQTLEKSLMITFSNSFLLAQKVL